MTPKMKKQIAEGGKSIVCESSAGENGGHAGLILSKNEAGKKTVLGHTDPVFKTAKEAKENVECVVDDIRGTGQKPFFKKCEGSGGACPSDEEKKSGKEK